MAIDQDGLAEAIEAVLSPHGIHRRERLDGFVTREGWTVFLLGTLGEAQLFWMTPEDASRIDSEHPGPPGRELEDTAMHLNKVDAMAKILTEAGFKGEVELSPNGTPFWTMTQVPLLG